MGLSYASATSMCGQRNHGSVGGVELPNQSLNIRFMELSYQP